MEAVKHTVVARKALVELVIHCLLTLIIAGAEELKTWVDNPLVRFALWLVQVHIVGGLVIHHYGPLVSKIPGVNRLIGKVQPVSTHEKSSLPVVRAESEDKEVE